jgi:DEAD/DEAH box helicase domain-containing protein
VNPPVVNHQLGIRRSYLAETRRVASEFLKRNLQLIRLRAEPPVDGDPDHVSEGRLRGGSRRAGEDPRLSRRVSAAAPARDRKRAARRCSPRRVSNNALELGIDIGALDVSVMAGYPGTIAATWQRAGRAGRRSGRSAAVMVASSAPLDQFVVRNPSYFFDASPERALIDPDNLHILVDHIKCAAFELPFTSDRNVRRPTCRRAGRSSASLAEQGLVIGPGENRAVGHVDQRIVPAPTPSACGRCRRTTSSSSTSRRRRVIGETDFTSGPGTLHPKAILHRPKGRCTRRSDSILPEGTQRPYVRRIELRRTTQRRSCTRE